jgi:hypothetical protein
MVTPTYPRDCKLCGTEACVFLCSAYDEENKYYWVICEGCNAEAKDSDSAMEASSNWEALEFRAKKL